MRKSNTLYTVTPYNKRLFAVEEDDTAEEKDFSMPKHSEDFSEKKYDDKLHVVNKYNAKKFNKKENLFLLGGQSSLVDDYLTQWVNDTNMQGYGMPISSSVNGKDFSFNFTNPQQNASITKTSPIVAAQTPMQKIAQNKSTADRTVKVDNTGLGFSAKQTPDNVTVINNGTGMTSTVDKAKNAVMQVAGVDSDLARWDRLASKAYGANYGDSGFTLDDYKKSTNKLGISKEANPFSKGNIGGTMKGIGAAAAAMGTEIGKSEANPRGMFDVLDPVHALAGGRESAVGNAMSDAGVGVFQAGASSGQPYLMIAGAALKVLGGLSNAAFGIKADKKMLNRANESISSNKNFTSGASSFDLIKGPAAASNTNVYEGGWFSGGKADDKNEALAKEMADAYSWADRSVQNNINNLTSDQINEFLRNYSAFGGYLTRPKRKRKIKR